MGGRYDIDEPTSGSPLRPDAVTLLSVPRAAQEAYIAIHGGQLASAEWEIRALVEDLARDGVFPHQGVPVALWAPKP